MSHHETLLDSEETTAAVAKQNIVKDPSREEEAAVKTPVILLSELENANFCNLTKLIRELGGVMTNNPHHCTHFVTDKVSKSEQFIQCIPKVKHVVNSAWIYDSVKVSNWLPEDSYSITCENLESALGFKLSSTLSRNNRDKLFSGKIFFFTPNVKPSVDALSKVVENSGGK